MSSYARLRSNAAIMTRDDFANLTAPLSTHDAKERDLDRTRVEDLAPWFLLSDFDLGLFTRSLGGHYTGDFSQFDAIDEAISSLHTIPHNEEEPPINFENASHLLHHGFPRIGHFTCNRNDTLARNLYDNHSSIEEHKSLIEGKIRIDVNKSYAIALPRSGIIHHPPRDSLPQNKIKNDLRPIHPSSGKRRYGSIERLYVH